MKRQSFLESYASTVQDRLRSKKLYLIYAIVLLILFFFFRKIWTPEASQALLEVNLFYAVIACFLYGLALVVRGYRLNVLLSFVKKLDLRKVISIQIISQTIGLYTTAVAEAVKAAPLKVSDGIPVKKTIKIFVIEKGMDLFVNLAVLLLAIPYLALFFPDLATNLFRVSIISVVLIAVFGSYWMFTKHRNRIREVGISGLASLGIFLIKFLGIYFVFLALGINPSLYLLFVIYVILATVSAISFVPFGLGVKEPLMVVVSQAAVGLAGIGAFTILINIVIIITYTVMALFCLVRQLG